LIPTIQTVPVQHRQYMSYTVQYLVWYMFK
jgi:hypothetical protein